MHNIFYRILFILLLFTAHCLQPAFCNSEIIERVVAIVNNNVILLSEFKDALKAAKMSDEKVTEDAVLDEMINRVLMLEQAKKMRLGQMEDATGPVDDNKIINEYIDRRIRSFVHIPIEEIESYYLNNRKQFGSKPFSEAKDEIENHLTEGELKLKIAEHVEELRKKAYIRIQKDPVGLR